MQKKRRDKMFKNGTLWNDIDGNPIHAHGGWMLSYGGYFYWYGEARGTRGENMGSERLGSSRGEGATPHTGRRKRKPSRARTTPNP